MAEAAGGGGTAASSNLASNIGKSPKIARKVVKELDRQPNGAFIAQTASEDTSPSPRTKRSNNNGSSSSTLAAGDSQVS